MKGFFNRKGSVIGGIIGTIVITILSLSKVEIIQFSYSIIIFFLVFTYSLREIQESLEKNKQKREQDVLDGITNSVKAVKAISIAENAEEEGRKTGKMLIKLWEVVKKIMNKIKEFFEKFKGYIATILLAILTMVEQYGGYINTLFGGALTINGVEVLPIITLGCTVVVGILSDRFTKEQQEKIKALFSKSTTNELVVVEIKKSIKTATASLSEQNKLLTTKNHELDNLNSEYETLNNTYKAKVEMYNMTPQLATKADVMNAEGCVGECKEKILAKTAEIDEVKAKIEELTTTINALKSQL